MTWRELSEHNETKIYLKYSGLTRRGLKWREFRSMIDRDASLKFTHNKAQLEISGEQASRVQKKTIHTSLERAMSFYYITRNAFKYNNNKTKKIGTRNITCTVPNQFALPSTIKKQFVLSSIWTKFEYIFPV